MNITGSSCSRWLDSVSSLPGSARLAPVEIASLLEMSADDYSARRHDPLHLATALIRMSTSSPVPSCALGASGGAILTRVERLLDESRSSKKTAMASVLIAGAIFSTPIVVLLSF
jgi:hypothetical protein